jgi:hypothetical protein
VEWLALPFGLELLTYVFILGTLVVCANVQQISKYTGVEGFEFGQVVS